MKTIRLVQFLAGAVTAFVALAAAAGDTSVGLRLGFVGGPCLSAVVAQRVGPNTVVKVAVGGFPGIILRVQANVAMLPEDKERGFFGTGGIGYNRYYRGQADGHGLTELHAGLGHFWRTGGDLLLAPEAGLLYVPTSLSPWVKDIWNKEGKVGPRLPIVPYAGIDLLRERN